MAALSSLLAVGGLLASVGGTAAKVVGDQRVGEAQRKVEKQRKAAMEIDAERKQIEMVRNAQRASALATANATAQGAQSGSGLQGGLAQIAGQTNFNIQGVQDNLAIGRQIFDLNAQASKASSFAGMGAGIASLGGQMTSASNLNAVNNLSKGFKKDPYSDYETKWW